MANGILIVHGKDGREYTYTGRYNRGGVATKDKIITRPRRKSPTLRHFMYGLKQVVTSNDAETEFTLYDALSENTDEEFKENEVKLYSILLRAKDFDMCMPFRWWILEYDMHKKDIITMKRYVCLEELLRTYLNGNKKLTIDCFRGLMRIYIPDDGVRYVVMMERAEGSIKYREYLREKKYSDYKMNEKYIYTKMLFTCGNLEHAGDTWFTGGKSDVFTHKTNREDMQRRCEEVYTDCRQVYEGGSEKQYFQRGLGLDN